MIPRQVCVLIGLLFFSCAAESCIEDPCGWESCKIDYERNTSQSTNITDTQFCSYIAEAELCFQECCGGIIDLQVFKANLKEEKRNKNCSTSTPTPTSSTTGAPQPTPPASCISNLPMYPTQVSTPSAADYSPGLSLVGALCKKHDYHALRQCSLFTYSHLRQFNGSTSSCLLPGSWYLLKHKDVSIEVSGKIKSNGYGLFTGLDKVNITLRSTQCTFGATFNYVASAGSPLPSDISTTDATIRSLYHPLEFNIDGSKTTASILAPWLNLTVIIRKVGDQLSIVLRLPADIMDESEGLCQTGCPNYMQYNRKKILNKSCSGDSYKALLACSVTAGLLNFFIGKPTVSSTMAELCRIDTLYDSSYSLLPLYIGIAKDILALPATGVHVRPKPHTPYNFNTNTKSSTSTTSADVIAITIFTGTTSSVRWVTATSSAQVSITSSRTQSPSPTVSSSSFQTLSSSLSSSSLSSSLSSSSQSSSSTILSLPSSSSSSSRPHFTPPPSTEILMELPSSGTIQTHTLTILLIAVLSSLICISLLTL